jgi:hypothetical protein
MRPIIESELLTQASALGMLACLAASVLLPWVSRILGRGYRIRWTVALAVAATCLFLVSHFTMPSKYNIRIDLIVFPLFLLIAWVHCGVVSMVSLASQWNGKAPRSKTTHDKNG